MSKYIIQDFYGYYLQILGDGKTIQHRDPQSADHFNTHEDAMAALKRSGELDATVEQMKPTKAGVRAALISLGYATENDTPPALRNVEAAETFTAEELSFAKYLIYDTDFGGAWSDNKQIEMHCV